VTEDDGLTAEENDYLTPIKKVKPKRPKNPLRKESALSKITLPHPGMSYNPDYDDHQELLLQAYLVELKKLRDEQKLMHRLKGNLKKMTWKEIEDNWLQEMSVNNLFENDEDEQKNEVLEQEIKDYVKFASKSSKEKKTAKQKKKQLMEKLKQKQVDLKKKARLQQNEIFRLKSIKKELKKAEEEQKEKKMKKDIEDMHRELFGTKRLSRLKYEEPELEIKLGDELSGNLRNLKVRFVNSLFNFFTSKSWIIFPTLSLKETFFLKDTKVYKSAIWLSQEKRRNVIENFGPKDLKRKMHMKKLMVLIETFFIKLKIK
jgi:nucleolar protein 53